MLRLHSLAYPVTALGPGRRVAIWVAGCGLRCPGCITPALLDRGSGREIPITRLARHILDLDLGLDGMTLSGGEPFDQAAALTELIESILSARPAWSVMAFSGYRLERLRQRGTDVERLLGFIDVLIDGPYVATRPAKHPLAGSDNQRVQLLTARGRALGSLLDAAPFNQANLGIGPSGRSMLIGVVDSQQRRAYHRSLGVASTVQRGVHP